LSSRITNKESLGQNWGLSTVSGTGVSAGERSTVKSRSRGRAQGQLARRLVTDKLDAHRRLVDTLSETVHTHSLSLICCPSFLSNLPTYNFLHSFLPTFLYSFGFTASLSSITVSILASPFPYCFSLILCLLSLFLCSSPPLNT
jgi:hypothetical protein